MIVKNNSEEISLKELILKIQEWSRYLLSKWYLFAIAFILGGILGYYYVQNKKVLYKATTTFVLESGENTGGGIGQMAGLAALAGVDLGQSGGGIFQGENLFELYKSRKMIESTLLLPSSSDSSLLLIDRYLALTNTRNRWKEKKPELLQINFLKNIPQDLLRARDSILQKVVGDINKDNLVVGKNDKKSAIIKVDVISTDEVFSKEFNEALVAQVNDFYVRTKTKKSLGNIEILQHKTDSVRAVMNGNISTAAVVMDATPNLNPTRQAQRIVPTQRSQFSAETNKAILGQMVQNLEMSKMALMKEAPLIQKIDEPIYPLVETKLSKSLYSLIFGFLSAFIVMVVLVIARVYNKVLK
ncbi:lipopolysaccharide biosynthesis protein [Sphingobacterium sp. KU25419]|nr:lipopolysaccharide biosynthesis protein [Sphingobacterium sp. KU25419]